VLALVRLAHGDARPALVALPAGALLLAVLAVASRWPPTAWLLLVPVMIGPAALAYRVGTPRAWNAVGVYALGGIAAGYGLLDPLLCRAVDGPCNSTTAWVVAAVGGAVALACYGWLLAQARVRT
jgi:hypothetical protein